METCKETEIETYVQQRQYRHCHNVRVCTARERCVSGGIDLL